MTKARDLADIASAIANNKIPSSKLDVSFENISDTGTEGTKVASGTTAQRGSTTGQWRYNTTTGFFEGRNASGNFQSLEPTPTIISTDVSEVDSNAGGNVTIRVTGTNFTTGGTIKFIGNDATEITASTSTFINSSNYDAVIAKASFVNSKEPYDVKYIASSGLTAQLDDQINVDTSPTWSTASGSLGNVNEGASGSFSVSATDADSDTVAYSLQSGSLGGLSLNSSTGAITGTASNVGSATTNSFTLRATAGGKTVDRAFSFITNNSTVGTLDVFGDSSCIGLYGFNNTYSITAGSLPDLSDTGSPTFSSSIKKFGSHSINLNGNGKYVDINTTTRFYAVSGWYYPVTANPTNTDAYIYEMRHDNSGNGRAYLYTLGSSQSGKVQHISTNSDTTASGNVGDVYVNGTLLSGAYHFAPNAWYHIVCSVNNASSTSQIWNEGLRFGSRADGASGGLSDYQDHVRIFNRALTSSEVTTLYNEF